MSMVILGEDDQVTYVRDRDRWSSWWAVQENRGRATVAISQVGPMTVVITVVAPVAEDRCPFLTSVHGGIYDGHQRRYRTRDLAVAGHSEITRMCRP